MNNAILEYARRPDCVERIHESTLASWKLNEFIIDLLKADVPAPVILELIDEAKAVRQFVQARDAAGITP